MAVADERGKANEAVHPLFSFDSHRLRICMFLLLALFIGSSNRMTLSTSIVCMVNSSTSNTNDVSNVSSTAKCARSISMSHEDDLAVEGHLDWSPSKQSMLLSSSFYGSFLTIIIAGAVIDQFSPSRILYVSLLVSSLLTIIAPFLSNSSFDVFLASRLVIGVTESVNLPAINMLASRWFPIVEKPILAALYTSGIQFAAGGSSLISAEICRSTFLHGWPAIFYIFGVATVIFVVFWCIFVVDSPSSSRWTSDEEKMYLARMIRVPKQKPSLRTSPWRAICSSSAVHSVMICSFAFGFSTSTMQAFLPTYLREQLALPVDKIGQYTLAPFFAQIVGKTTFGLITGFVVKRGFLSLTTVTRMSQSLGSFGATITLMAFAHFPTCSNPDSSMPILIAYGLIYAGGVTGYFTSLLTIAPKYTGTLTALYQLFTMLAMISSSTLVTTLTSMDSEYKWTIIFGTASLIQTIAGLHFMVFGSTETQYWADGVNRKIAPA
ncbi:hypothetical protein PENTCL1PPCAC_17268 [Pristionchus entomophagus]|uniref:Major facilitator superfamily (MFS) profile domain-containing protein n=1 Tax=Pristionchus entomophagus TaxID=358040 RepID=A0AAV5TLH5_9BILA|nr:hypothetical protein PENTCL1PPCAC_17268 [Pristionchus entomophagus]